MTEPDTPRVRVPPAGLLIRPGNSRRVGDRERIDDGRCTKAYATEKNRCPEPAAYRIVWRDRSFPDSMTCEAHGAWLRTCRNFDEQVEKMLTYVPLAT